MKTRFLLHVTAAASVAAALVAGVSMSTASPLPNDAWNANGATACETLLTPPVMAAILENPSGAAAKDTATSCHRSSVYISLKVMNPQVLKSEIPRIAFAHAMTGVGDVAFWNPAGAVSSAKGPDRGCDISVLNAPNAAKIHDAALGQKLGEVCNKLFALK